MRKRIFLHLLLIICLIFEAGLQSYAKDIEKYTFEVLSTTDMHGRATERDVISGQEEENSMVRVATVVKEERKKYGNRLILIDNGDLLQGTLVTQYALTQKPDEENPMITAIKDLKYDVWVMGNHEFNYLPKQRNPQIKYAQDAGIAVLGGNIVLKENGVNMHGTKVNKGAPYYTPFIIKTIDFDDKKQVRVAIIGFGNANNANWDRECNYPNMQFSSLDNPNGLLEFEIEKWIKNIKKNNLADIIIVSAHSGKTDDTGAVFNKFSKESQAVTGIKNSSDVDLLIYGHDHSPNIEEITNKAGKKVWIMNGGCTSVTKNVFDVHFDENDKYKDYTVSASAVKLADVKSDKQLAKKLEHWYSETLAWTSAPLGTLGKGWNKYINETKGKTNKDLILNQTHIIDLIHKAQIWASWQNYEKNGIKGAEVSIASSVLAFNQDGTVKFVPHDKQKISTREVSQIYHFSNNLLCTVDMTPKQLYDWMNTVADKLTVDENGKISVKSDESAHGVDSFYGVDYIFDVSKPEGQRIVYAKINGQNLIERKEPVRVALNTFRISGCHGFYEATGLKESDCVWESSETLSEDEASVQSLLGSYIKHKKIIFPNDNDGHYSKWKIIK